MIIRTAQATLLRLAKGFPILAITGPRGLLAQFPNGAIFDEAQRAPELFSYIQTRVDTDLRLGFYVLTGSQQFGLAGWLLGIREPGQLAFHAQRGSLFENLVVTEFVKSRLNQGFPPMLL